MGNARVSGGVSLNGLHLGFIGVGKRPLNDFATEDLPGYVRTDAAGAISLLEKHRRRVKY
jgi:hypothetical protein